MRAATGSRTGVALPAANATFVSANRLLASVNRDPHNCFTLPLLLPDHMLPHHPAVSEEQQSDPSLLAAVYDDMAAKFSGHGLNLPAVAAMRQYFGNLEGSGATKVLRLAARCVVRLLARRACPCDAVMSVAHPADPRLHRRAPGSRSARSQTCSLPRLVRRRRGGTARLRQVPCTAATWSSTFGSHFLPGASSPPSLSSL